MRVYLHLSPNREVIPFNYQRSLVGAFHRWLGENELHDDTSLYSLSWLSQNGRPTRGGLNFPQGATMFISAPHPDLLSKVIHGVFRGTQIRWGMEVQSVKLTPPPTFSSHERFRVQSPVLLKRSVEGEEHHKYFYYNDPISDQLLTETLHYKLNKLGLSTDISLAFDHDYAKPRIKMVTFKGIDIKASSCPVIAKGNPEAIAALYALGAGVGTGIGFGALV